MAKTSAVVIVVGFAVETTADYLNGKEIGESAKKNGKAALLSTVCSTLGGSIGTAIFPGVGTMIGGFIGGVSGTIMSSLW